MDGSAKDFLKVLKKTEKVKLTSKRKYLKIVEKVQLNENEKPFR